MKKNNKFFASLTATTLALAFIPATFAFGGYGEGEGERYQIDREAMEEAIETEDYDAWKALLPENMQSNATEDNFNRMVENHSQMEERREAAENHREAMQTAIDAGDYAAWKAEMESFNPDSPMLEKITADNFSQLQEMHSYQNKAREIGEKLGIGRMGFEGGERGEGMRMGGKGGFGMGNPPTAE